MTVEDVRQWLAELNNTDEHPRLEAKRGVGEALYETICAFSNEPALGGGVVIVGVEIGEEEMFEHYSICGVSQPDRLSNEIASGCASRFNIPIRPQVTPVAIDGHVVLVVEVEEAHTGGKPIYFKKRGLPSGAYRRIGTSDQRCTEEDLSIFYSERDRDPYDARILPGATLNDLDPDAIDHYRKLRAKVIATAEELSYEDLELLQALNAIRDDNGTWRPTLTGLLFFGKRLALRRELPAVRVDYIRVAGKEWVPDPDRRYESTIDMRGPLLQLVDRAQATVQDDLPKGFELPEGSVQALTPSLPARALREAIVNALMHRSYRIDRPTQIIRYSNRIEIVNAGFSLKNEVQLGDPGSQLRNANIAAIFHETNIAETKGTGIRVMREQMRAAGFTPPTFESDRGNDCFTARFLLHHFLNEDDLRWFGQLGEVELSDAQKYALIFVRENGAIDNPTLRQLTQSGDTLATSSELRKLRDLGFIEKKGAGTATYYVRGSKFPSGEEELGTLDGEHGTLAPEHGTLGDELGTLSPDEQRELERDLPEELREKICGLGARPGDSIRSLIVELCAWKPLSTPQLAALLTRNPRSLRRDHLKPLVDEGRLQLTIPDMGKHPDQAYQTPPSE